MEIVRKSTCLSKLFLNDEVLAERGFHMDADLKGYRWLEMATARQNDSARLAARLIPASRVDGISLMLKSARSIRVDSSSRMKPSRAE